MNGKLSLRIFSHHDQNIFFCKTLCQSLSSPRPRVASRVSAATWVWENKNIFLSLENFEEKNHRGKILKRKTASKHPTPPGLGEQPLCPLRDILAIHLRWKFRKSDLKWFLRILGFARFNFEPQAVWFSKNSAQRQWFRSFPMEIYIFTAIFTNMTTTHRERLLLFFRLPALRFSAAATPPFIDNQILPNTKLVKMWKQSRYNIFR